MSVQQHQLFTDILDARNISYSTSGGGIEIWGGLNLDGCTGLTSLPDGLTVGGGLNLGGCTGLTSLPDGLTVGGYLILRGCTDLLEGLGAEIVDGFTMLVSSRRRRGEMEVAKAYYYRDFGLGRLVRRGSNACWIARQDGFAAHGETMRDALSDLAFKVESETRDKADVRRAVVEADRVRVADYRLLTGACAAGVAAHLAARGVDTSKTESLTVEKALVVSRGGYGHEQFAREIELARAGK